MSKNVVHYIGSEWNNKFIISITKCGISWRDVKDSTEYKDIVTCKKCLKQIEKDNYDTKRKSC